MNPIRSFFRQRLQLLAAGHQVLKLVDANLVCGSPAYSLTTYEQPRQEMVQVIVGMIAGRLAPETVTLPGTLVVRNST